MEITKTKPNDYISKLPDSQKDSVQKIDKLITKIAPKIKRVMWEGKFWGGSEQKIIGYGTLTYIGSNKKEVEWFIVGLAAQKNYITIFVSAVEDKEYVVEKYKDEIGKAKIGKSTISFKNIEDLNLDTIQKIVKKAFKISKSK
jgi:uncharacterized protein YdhG (YjbR/CyaY superfamily)